MNFFNSKIVTKTISLEDAIKKANEPKAAPRSLDEILASAKQMKTAAAQAETKTAAVAPAPKAEAKAEAPKPEAKKPEVKVAAAKPTVAVKVAAELAPKPAEAPKAEAPKPEAKKPEVKAAAAKPITKWASSIDFRNWEAQAVVDAWNQHGSVEKCVANVGSKATDGKVYCELLRVAASEADKVVKTASAKKEQKTAAPVYRKIAKLTAQEQSFLRDFFKKIYGEEYVSALLDDY